ncbi:unnamed protein product, partial [Mesorhabditis spiculigera]
MLTPASFSKVPEAETPKASKTKKIRRAPRRVQHSISISTEAPVSSPSARKSHSVSPPMIGCYAGGKSIPLPPTTWIEEFSSASSSTSNNTSDSENSSPEPQPAFLTPKTCRQSARAELSSSPASLGRRMCPLQLISEITAVSIGN